MIQKLEYETYNDGNGNVYGAIPSDAEIIAKINEVIDYINSLSEEKPSENLNDEIKKFIEEYGYKRGEDKLLIAIVARHFAEWQKEQMMKDAVEGEIVKDITNKLAVTAKNINLDGFKFGDKVKIIIVKQ